MNQKVTLRFGELLLGGAVCFVLGGLFYGTPMFRMALVPVACIVALWQIIEFGKRRG